MTDLGETIAVLMNEILEHSESNCPFCKENEPPEKVESNIDQNLDEDEEDDDEYMTKQIGNKSGDLDKNMAAEGEPRPTDWGLELPVFDCSHKEIDLGDNHKVTPNPHHLIPGNESLKEAPELLKWIFESEGHISGDIGYNVNNAMNGIWLPSNNSMRGNSDWKCRTVKITYANAAQPGRGCFHDRHINYSDFVIRLLNKIADRMDGINAQVNCPYKTEEEDGKFKPPYALVERLNGVSQRLRGYLTKYNPDGFKAPLYTSKLVEERVRRLIDYDAGKASVPVKCSVHK